MKNNNNLLTSFAIWLIKNLWKKYLSINYNKKRNIVCRFYPTCSEYAILALNKYGLLKGLNLARLRVKKCTKDNTESCYNFP
ncbi:MAG: membrane protein insertion efficiency factor YidD [Candidatus Shapirobacteria bacterium]|jgi:hypothetical protein